MGLFDFMSSAGEKEITDTVQVSQERIDELRKDNISSNLAKLDIEGEQVSVEVNGEIAILTGSAPSQEAMEKMVLCAGNQHGIGRVDCRVTVDQTTEQAPAVESDAGGTPAADTSPSTFYTVEPGDSLGKIAQQFYGNASEYMKIFEANQPMLENPDKIFPGQSLRIPAG